MLGIIRENNRIVDFYVVEFFSQCKDRYDGRPRRYETWRRGTEKKSWEEKDARERTQKEKTLKFVTKYL